MGMQTDMFYISDYKYHNHILHTRMGEWKHGQGSH